MKITVKRRDGFSFDMRAEPDDLVADVKHNIEKKCGQTLYLAENQLLRYEGKVLKDDTTLKDNNVHDNCSIVLIRQVLAKPSRVSSTTTSTTTMVPPSNSVPPSSTNPDSTPSPLTAVTANTNVRSCSHTYGQEAKLIQFASDIFEGMPSKLAPVLFSRIASENAYKRAAEYRNTGIPAHARVSPVAKPLTSSSAVNAPVRASQIAQFASQFSQLAPPAPRLSGSNASPLNLFPHAKPVNVPPCSMNPNSTPSPLTTVKANSDDNFDVTIQCVRDMCGGACSRVAVVRSLRAASENAEKRAAEYQYTASVQANHQILESMPEELGGQNPSVRQGTQDHQAEFMQDMAQPPLRPVGNLSNQSAVAIPQEMTFTLEEQEAIDRVNGSGSLLGLQQG